jgi:hypothetical protein
MNDSPSFDDLPKAQRLAERAFRTLDQFLHVEAVSGIVLLAAAVVALIWANPCPPRDRAPELTSRRRALEHCLRIDLAPSTSAPCLGIRCIAMGREWCRFYRQVVAMIGLLCSCRGSKLINGASITANLFVAQIGGELDSITSAGPSFTCIAAARSL